MARGNPFGHVDLRVTWSGPDYYAVYFADPCGNRLEVYFRQAG